VIGAIVSFPAALPVIKFGAGDLLDFFLIWLGVSVPYARDPKHWRR
jgi:hypothetical protein